MQQAAFKAEATPVVEGNGVITGTVLSTKNVESYYGTTTKMLVLDDRNFKVWGTLPSALEGSYTWNEARGDYDEVVAASKGDRVSFVANVEASDDDKSFGFFKRPRKAAFVQRVLQEEG